MKEVIVAGKILDLSPMNKSDLKGVYIDAVLRYDFYQAAFNDSSFCLLVPKQQEQYAPLQYKQIADRLEKIISLPIVFLFDRLEYYQRNRLIERGVFFIVSEKYTYLPYLIINAKETSSKSVKSLTASAQYLLLFHLQRRSLDSLTIKEIEDITPYKYVTLSRAVTCLESLQLCRGEKDENRNKRIFFEKKQSLWNNAQAYLINPIQKVVYSSKVESSYVICGENALAHYTNLNPSEQKMVAIDENVFRDDKAHNLFVGLNDVEGDTKIEIWKYPPLGERYVDRLSLYITLKEVKDARVEKELDKMMTELW